MSTVARTSSAVLLAAVLALGLAACGAPDPAPTTDPAPGASAEPTPTPSASVEPDAGPHPVIGVTCDQLVPAAVISASIPGIVSADPVASQLGAYLRIAPLGAYPPIAEAHIVRSLGGIACEWNNGESYSSKVGSNPAYVGVRIQILPNATSQWEKYERIYDASYGGFYCTLPNCRTNALVGTNWIEALIIGVSTQPAAQAISDSALAALAAAGPGAPAWSAPSGTIAIGPACTDTLSETVVGLLFGVGVPLVAGNDGGGWSLGAGAGENALMPTCYYSYENEMAGVGSLRGLPAGGWAWQETRPLLTSPSVPEPLAVVGLEDGDEAWIRCSVGDERCTLDLVVGNNWFQFETRAGETGVAPGASMTVGGRDALSRIAEAILGELRG